MDAYSITNRELRELKQTMGFRISEKKWTEFADARPDGTDSCELVEFVKQWMNPPYEVEEDIDEYLHRILKLFVAFVRSSNSANRAGLAGPSRTSRGTRGR